MDFGVVGEAVDQFQFHLDLLAAVDQADHAAVVLERHVEFGKGFGIPGRVADAGSARDIEGTAAVHDAQRLLRLIEIGHQLAELHHGAVIVVHPSAAVTAGAGLRPVVLGHRLQFLLVIAGSQRLEIDLDRPRGRDEQDLAGHLSAVFLKVFLGLDVEHDAFALDKALGAAGPGPGGHREGAVIGRGHRRIRLDDVPAAAGELRSIGGTGIRQPDFRELHEHERVGTALLEGSGEPGTDIVRHELGQFFDLGAAQAFRLDAGGPIGRFSDLRIRHVAAEGQGQERQGDQKSLHRNGFVRITHV